MELVAASGTINQSMLAYCHYFDIVIALMYLDIQGDFFQMVLYRSGPTQQDKLAKYTGPTQETGPPNRKND